MLLLAMLVWSLFSGPNGQGPAVDRAAAQLSDFELHESDLHRDMLSGRAGLLRNYDPINKAASSLEADLLRLQAGRIAADAADSLLLLAARQAELVETFKSNNALLQNGLAYFSLFSERLRTPANSASLVQAANDLSAAVLQLTLDTSPETTLAVQRALAELAAQPATGNTSEAVGALLSYGQLLSQLLPSTDGLLKSTLALPFAAEAAQANEVIAGLRKAERVRTAQYRALLYATSLLLFMQLAYFGLQLQRRRLAARRRAGFERAVATLSVRLIECNSDELPGLIAQALAQLAQVAGADRTYFVIGGPAPQTFAWARPGVGYPAGWPRDAAELARRFPAAEHGITHIPDRHALPGGPVRAKLSEIGVQRWTVVSGEGRQALPYVLGLDHLAGEQQAGALELRLLRMAFDAIASAVRRETHIRERAQMEASVQRARQVETIAALTGGVAHNFNNIVGTILGYTEMIDEAPVASARLAQQVAEIRKAAGRARTLVEQLLGYGKKRNARRDLIDMPSLLAETIGQLTLSLPKTVRIVASDLPDSAVRVSGDAAHLQQVIVNLCSNAAQAMGNHGAVTVTCDVQELNRERRLSHGHLAAGRYVRLAVSDSGNGIRAETLERIFEPFFTTRVDGNGLGLATVRSIVQDHGGALHVQTTFGTGSRFEAWLPLADLARSAATACHWSQPFGDGETVLLLSDHDAKLLQEEEVVAALGYEPVGFSDSKQMYAAFKAAPGRFDIAVIGISGPSAQADAVRRLRSVKPAMPVIVLAALPGELSGDDLRLQGCEIVPHSSGSAELAAALRRGLERREHFAATGEL